MQPTILSSTCGFHGGRIGYLEEHMEEACYRIGIVLADHLQQRSCHHSFSQSHCNRSKTGQKRLDSQPQDLTVRPIKSTKPAQLHPAIIILDETKSWSNLVQISCDRVGMYLLQSIEVQTQFQETPWLDPTRHSRTLIEENAGSWASPSSYSR